MRWNGFSPVAALGALALAVLVAPVVALGSRVPWARLPEILCTPETAEMLVITVSSAAIATAITLALSIPLAVWTSSLRRGSHLARVVVLLPLTLPPVVAGLALNALIGRRGLAAPLLDALGVSFAFTFAGVVASHVFVALPFAAITLDSALRQFDRAIVHSAAGVGMSQTRIARRILLPALAPALAAAAGLSFARSLGEFGTTLTFAGSLPGQTRTMPIGIYLAREVDYGTAYGLAAVLALLAVAVLAATTLPALLRRPHRHQVHALGPIDASTLLDLAAPAAAAPDLGARGPPWTAARITALIGPNGAGKTTLLREVAAADPGAAALLPQRPALPPAATALDCVAMVTRDPDLARRMLEAAGLAALSEVPAAALSGGQSAQVALVRALAARRPVLLLDEPFAAMDVTSAHAWRGVIRAARNERTVVFVTHDLYDLYSVADEVAVVDHGRLTAARPVAAELAAPSTTFVARLVGMNRVPGSLLSATRAGTTAVFPPSAVRVSASGEAGHVTLRSRVVGITALRAGDMQVELDVADGVLAAAVTHVHARQLAIGDAVGVHVDPDAIEFIAYKSQPQEP
ncbi:ATP-binding cassette domain-containing protein [Corynebacterium sp.]|uniref:ATP-binding cassette domain-containing protein n=1 Tax=Corynebacterium sp. TaxID=1720 RepID=UPI002A919D13|nr:ATP-binding cassette domain-containing protein [Corynebacterium sp.]MDY5786258.1 ATP-binding cassette domain-containing protein [Corynebacterium sp.]